MKIMWLVFCIGIWGIATFVSGCCIFAAFNTHRYNLLAGLGLNLPFLVTFLYTYAKYETLKEKSDAKAKAKE